MRLSQLRIRGIPIWSTFAACCLAGLSACSNESERAITQAAEAQQLLEAGDLQGARLAIASAIAARDDIAEFHLLRARIELALGSRPGAFDAYTNVLALDATNGEALLAIAQLGLATGNLRESLEAAERLSTLAPNRTDALVVRGVHALVRRRHEEAIEFGERILEINPRDPAGSVLKSRALFMSGRPAEALEVLEPIAGHPEATEAVALTRLEIYRTLRDRERLSGEFIKLRELRQTDSHLALDEANFRFKTGQRALGHELIGRAIASGEADREAADAAVALWTEYGSHDLPATIVQSIGEAGSTAVRQIVTRFLIEAGELRSARVLADRLPRSMADPLRARLLNKEDRPQDALRLANMVLSGDATNCDALIAAGEAALMMRRPADALRWTQQAAAECPDRTAAWIAAAQAYELDGREGGVSRVYLQGLDANKQNRPLAERYANWLMARGRGREALAVGRRLTRYAPALTSGWQLYHRLCNDLRERCASEAAQGLADAKTIYGVDLPYGASPPNGLFGRFVQR